MPEPLLNETQSRSQQVLPLQLSNIKALKFSQVSCSGYRPLKDIFPLRGGLVGHRLGEGIDGATVVGNGGVQQVGGVVVQSASTYSFLGAGRLGRAAARNT
jgi:hypothetical protein